MQCGAHGIDVDVLQLHQDRRQEGNGVCSCIEDEEAQVGVAESP